MKIRDSARRAARSLGSAKARTLLTSLAIAVGAFTLTISLAAGEGARQYTDKLIGTNINPRVLFIVKDKSLFGEGGQQQSGFLEYDPDTRTTQRGTTIKELTQTDIDTLKARDDLESIMPIYQLSIKYLTIQGIDQKFSTAIEPYDSTLRNETSVGALPPLGTQIAQNDVVVPQRFADTLVEQKRLDKASDLVGRTITMTIARPVTQPTTEEINKILATEGPAGLVKLTEAETKDVTVTVRALAKKPAAALADISSLQISETQSQQVYEYTTKGTDGFQKYPAVTALARGDRKPVDVKAALEKAGYAAQTAQDLQSLIFTIVNILQGIVAGFGLLALLASVFGIINTQYISVLERTREIGLMKALGMRSRHVSRLFQYEAAWIGVLGGVIGSGIATVLGTALNPWVTKTLDLGEGNYLLIFQPIPIALLIIALALIAMAAGWIPARKAAKLDPIEALRTE